MAKQLTPAEIAAFMQTLGLKPSPPPTEAVGAVGSKPFIGDSQATDARRSNRNAYTAGLKKRVPVQNMNDLSSPKWWVKNLFSAGKSTFYDPIANMPKAFDPNSGFSPIERVNTALGGGLALADVLTPFVPEGALANALAKRAAENAVAKTAPNMIKPVGPTAADWFYGKYGVHGSPTQGITELQPRLGSNAFPNDKVTYAMDLANPTLDYDLREAVNRAMAYAPNNGSIYVSKYPRGYQTKEYNNFIVSDVPGKVVGEMKLGDLQGKLGDSFEKLVTDSAYQLQSQLLANIKSPSLRKKYVENLLKKERDFEAARIASRAEMAANSAQSERRYRGLGTGGGVS